MNQNRRNISPEFIAAVRAGLAKGFKQATEERVQTMTKVLYTTALIEKKVDGKMTIAENPHYMGRNVDTIAQTLKEMGK